jgi:hypothetical protein
MTHLMMLMMPDGHPYLLPGLQLDRVGPEDADDPPICYMVSSLTELVLRMPMTRLSYLVSSLTELVLRMPMTRLSVTWSQA